MTIHAYKDIIWKAEKCVFKLREVVGGFQAYAIMTGDDGGTWEHAINESPLTGKHAGMLIDFLEAIRDIPGVSVSIYESLQERNFISAQMWIGDPAPQEEPVEEPLHTCPHCGSEDIEVCLTEGGWAFVVCMDCRAHTGLCDNGYFAREAWQNGQITEYNEETDGDLFDL